MRGRRLVTTERIIAIVSSGGEAVLERLEAWATDNGIDIASVSVGESIEDVLSDRGPTIGVTIGGDGTYLEGIKQFAPREIPLLGIDTGTHPFLVRIDPDDMEEALREVIRGRASIESRSQLRVVAGTLEGTGLNDVMLEHVQPEDPVDRKITTFDVFVDEEYVGAYSGTGVAIATPTGSTGVSLSAGGPIHYPRNNRTLQITPMLTHDLSVRPIIVDQGATIAVESDGPVDLSVDGGRHHRRLEPGDPVRIEIAEEAAQLIHPSVEAGYFEALSSRLGWNLRDSEAPAPPVEVGSDDDQLSTLERAKRVAAEAAQSVGGPLRELHGQTESVEFKTDKSDIVTEADYQSESIITSIIENEFPGHNIHSEETVHHEGGSQYTWVIDPLDGTGNYANGNPNYAVSIGLVRDDEPVMGVVYAPETDELFSAIKGEGAYCDGTRISTTERSSLDESVFMSGYDPDGTFLTHFYNETRGVRRLGAVALHLCYLASGSCDATWEFDTYPWDTAAGVVIAQEAGATITDADGEPFNIYSEDGARNELIATNGPLHDVVLSHLQRHDQLR